MHIVAQLARLLFWLCCLVALVGILYEVLFFVLYGTDVMINYHRMIIGSPITYFIIGYIVITFLVGSFFQKNNKEVEKFFK